MNQDFVLSDSFKKCRAQFDPFWNMKPMDCRTNPVFLVPENLCRKRIFFQNKLSVNMYYSDYKKLDSGKPYFYYVITFHDNHGNPIVDHKLKPEHFFRLIQVADNIQRLGMSVICTHAKSALNGKNKHSMLIKEITSYCAPCPFSSRNHHPDPAPETLAVPTIVFRSSLRYFGTIGKGKNIHRMGKQLSVSCAPYFSDGDVRQKPWRIKAETIADPKASEEPSYQCKKFKVLSKSDVFLSDKDFFMLLSTMVLHFEKWWKVISREISKNCQNETN